jgi:nucleoside-diphosphate-sugar epimerase
MAVNLGMCAAPEKFTREAWGKLVANLLIFGAGYSGRAIAAAACDAGLGVAVASRGRPTLPGAAVLVPFEAAAPAIAGADYIISTAPPDGRGDPILQLWATAIAGGKASWLGYLSTTGVYGDRAGGWVDEATPPNPGADRSRRRLAAEQAWEGVASGRPLDLIRLAGIYGPGRSALDEVRSGRARRVVKPGHAFGRIHRDDIAAGVLAALAHPAAGRRVLNFSDDLPAESADVIAEAARLLGLPLPPAVPFPEAWAGMGDMGRSFWAENRKVGNAATKAALRTGWRYPTYKEGLAAILREERGQAVA